MQPPITVFIPVFNAERYVAQTIRSVLRQTWTEFELLVIDDGSTDSSLREIRATVGSDPRCKIHSRENRGIVATRNEGLELARGEFLFLIDADDIARPHRLATQLAYLRTHPECIAVGARVQLIDPDGLPIVEMIDHFTHEEIDNGNINVAGVGSFLFNPTAAIRREVMIRVGGYRPEFEWAEDYDLFLRLGEIGRLANIPEVLLDYRQHLASTGYARAQLQRTAGMAAVAQARQRRGLPPLAGGEDMLAEAATRAEAHRKWAWWALRGGNVATARKHALRSFLLEPLCSKNIKLIACAIRGR